jgi:hypothetical protein
MKKWTAVDLDDYRGLEPSGADMWSVVYLASDVDAKRYEARIAELEGLLRKCIDDDGAEQFLGTDLLQRINSALMAQTKLDVEPTVSKRDQVR